MNLTANALKFTAEGGITWNVTCPEITARDCVLHFAISDTGIGIPEEKLGLIFAPFSQADSSTTRKYGGTGLGLTICSRLVGMMDGRIWVESQVGKGSRFHFNVRLGLAIQAQGLPGRALPEESLGTGARARAAAPSGHAPDSASGEQQIALRILLVEDNAVNQKLAARLLEKKGHRVTLADNGRQALAALQKAEFDLVLMDMQMPEMDGEEATAAIRAGEKITGAHIPIIALTAHAMKGDREKCLAAGMDGYLTKPIRREELYSVLDSYASSRAAERYPLESVGTRNDL